MRVGLVTPAMPDSGTGNGSTAARWARILRGLGHHVHVTVDWEGRDYHLLVALHARKSAMSIERFASFCPGRPIVVALAGTDLYHDLPHGDLATLRSLALASRIVLLQPRGLRLLSPAMRRKAVVIYQSVPRPRSRAPARTGEVLVVANLRAVKDPLRTALAVRRLPAASKLRVVHIGDALDARLAARARAELHRNPRYLWLGPCPRAAVMDRLRRCRLLCLTSRAEGGANVVSEALACDTPIVASRIDGTLGILGPRYPGYFPAGDTRALRALLLRCERDPAFLARLARAVGTRARLIDPARERAAWRALLVATAAAPRAPGRAAARGAAAAGRARARRRAAGGRGRQARRRNSDA
jgi:putative glycosyltransferase (TIGR04348 family)